MAIASVILFLIVLFVRPGEIVPGWENYQFAAYTEALALLACAASWVMKPRPLLNQPHDAYVVGFFAAMLLSNPASGWMGGAVLAFPKLVPAMVCYVILRVAVWQPHHFRIIGAVLVALTLFQATNGIVQAKTGVGFGNVAVLTYGDRQVVDGVEQALEVPRIQGTGIFADPNDLAMLFVVALPFLIGPVLNSGATIVTRVLSATLAAPLLLALFYTNSRGGIVGLVASMVPYIWRSGRTLTKIGVCLIFGLVMLAGPSRMSEMDAGEASAQGRIQAWSAGLQMLKSKPILGVGFDQYGEIAGIVAHNSFVHSVAETGLVGGFFFTGMFYWMFLGATPRPSAPTDAEQRAFNAAHPAAAGMSPAAIPEARIAQFTGVQTHPMDPDQRVRMSLWNDDLFRSCLGMAATMLFLSRHYIAVVYIFIGLSACYRNLLQTSGLPVRVADSAEIRKVGITLLIAVALVYVTVRVLAVWS